jgi:hypothetical protein
MGMLTAGKVLVVLLSLAVQMLHHNTDVKATLLWFAVTTLLELFFFSLGILCCMLTGWLLAVPVIYAAANSFAIIMTVLLQALGERVHSLLAAHTEGDVGKSKAGHLGLCLRQIGPGHDFQPIAAIKGEKVGLKVGVPVVIFCPGGSAKIGDEKRSCTLQVRHI